MQRYKITIEYDGTGFCGWQKQENKPSVQESIEKSIIKFTSTPTLVYGAGRTDSGVHALGQVAHFDLPRMYSTQTVTGAINYHIKPDKVVILNTEIVDSNFHARFSATRRYYKYSILNRQSSSVLDELRSWHIRTKLNIQAMQEASNILIGRHDFTSFRASNCQAKSAVKTIDDIKITGSGEYIDVYVSAPSFLHHMVRNIVGTIVLVGQEKWNVDAVYKALMAKNRKFAGPTAPPHGLYLTRVDYI